MERCQIQFESRTLRDTSKNFIESVAIKRLSKKGTV